MDEKARQIEAVRITQWIAENSWAARILLREEEGIKPKECEKVIESLQNYSLEYLIPILLFSKRYDIIMEIVIARINAEGTSKMWETLGTRQMVTNIKSKIAEEARRREASVYMDK